MLQWLRENFGWCVHCAEYNGWHFTLSKAEALEWMSQYPIQSKVTISDRKCNIVASRGLT